MNLSDFIENETKDNELSQKLVSELKKVSKDTEFIAGVLLDVENDEDKSLLLEYIKKGEDVNFEQIILNALWLNQQRKNNTRSNNG